MAEREYSPEELDQMGAVDAPEFSEADLDRMAATSQPTARDLGPAGRRAAAGMPSGPRDVQDDVELAPPTRQALSPLPLYTNEPKTVPGVTRPFTELEGDPLAQMVVTSTVLGPMGRAATNALEPAMGRLAAPLVGSAEGAAASKSMGGSAVAGAMLGAGFGALGSLSPRAAAARSNANLVGDVTKGTTKATGKNAKDVAFKAGEGGQNLSRVADEVPQAGKTLRTKAKTNPKAAAAETQNVISELTEQNDVVFDAIQAQHGGAPVKAITDKAADVWADLMSKGKVRSADAVKRFHDDLIENYGADVNLTAEQLRNIRNDIGETAFPTPGAKASTKRYAENKLYKLFNEVIEDVAGKTEGVDVAAFKARNRQISTLLPAQKALAERAGKLADRDVSLYQRAKELPRQAAQRAGRELDYRLSRLPTVDTSMSPSLPVGADVQRRRPDAAMAAQLLLHGAR